MKLICEVIEDVKYITEAKEDGKKDVYIEGVFMQGNIKNRNGRVYPSEILEGAVQKYIKENIQRNKAYGELGHPQGPSINLDRVSHMIKEIRQEGNNFIGRAKLMDTPMGMIAKNLISEGANLGVSSRGLGSIKENKDGIMEVQKDFFLATAADIVADPSAPDAFVNGIFESVDWIWNNDILVQRTAEQIKEEVNANVRSGTLTTEVKIKLFENYLNSLIK
jgi:hypothetical protein